MIVSMAMVMRCLRCMMRMVSMLLMMMRSMVSMWRMIIVVMMSLLMVMRMMMRRMLMLAALEMLVTGSVVRMVLVAVPKTALLYCSTNDVSQLIVAVGHPMCSNHRISDGT